MTVSPTPLGSWFAHRVTPVDAAVALGSAAVIVVALVLAAASFVGGISAGVVATGGIAAGVVGTVLAAMIVALRRGLDGDGMGAAVESSVVAGLVVAALVS
jgi:hypothetical protein